MLSSTHVVSSKRNSSSRKRNMKALLVRASRACRAFLIGCIGSSTTRNGHATGVCYDLLLG